MNFLQREVLGDTNFISIYYLEYAEDNEDLIEISGIIIKKRKD